MVTIPYTPCDCLTVNPCAFACVMVVATAYYKRSHFQLRRVQILNPRDGDPEARRAADAVLLCDHLKCFLGLLAAHALLFVHEAIESDGGRNETRFYFVMHMMRTCVDVVLATLIALLLWRCLVRYANVLASRGATPPLVEAMRASGRYSSAIRLNWQDESLDFRVDPDHPVTVEAGPSTLDQRVAARNEQDAQDDRVRTQDGGVNEDDGQDSESDDEGETAALRRRRRVNMYEPLPQWWVYQTLVWFVAVFVVGSAMVVLQVLWRLMLGADDPLFWVIEQLVDVADSQGDFICSGETSGAWVSETLHTLPDAGAAAAEWLALILFHMLVATALLSFVYHRHRYRGRTVHPAFQR